MALPISRFNMASGVKKEQTAPDDEAKKKAMKNRLKVKLNIPDTQEEKIVDDRKKVTY